jgi:hypothetical protein
MAEESEVRVYGMADQANRDPPAAEGMRGDKASARPSERDPALSHQVALGDGNTVTISEGSGVAFVEATGRAGLAEAKPSGETNDDDNVSARGFDPILLFAGLAVAAGIIALSYWSLNARASRT